jgi:hypothetical protein
MSGSYRRCVECGKRALSFATRCPGCGIELPSPAPFEEDGIPDSNRVVRMKAGMAVLAAGVMLVLLARGPARPAPLGAETSFVQPVTVEKPAVVEALMTTVAAPAMKNAGVSLIAKGWTHVRSRRRADAKLEAILTPGDTVVCDSLVNGWYRVALYGEVLGWAKQSTLTPIEP